MASLLQISDDFLAAKRLLGDDPVDRFIEKTFEKPDVKKALFDWLSKPHSNSSLHNLPDFLQVEEFARNAGQLPVWANRKMLKAGADFFTRYQEQIMQLLGLLSLPYCYAAADGAMVLYLSERLRSDGGKRLTDTGEFVMNVQSPGAFEDGGKGFSSALNIRITHALARYYTLKSGKWNPDWGIPVNQEDMAGTNNAFSIIVIRGLRKLGFSIGYEEQQSFLHLWNVVSYLLGLQDELIPQTGKEAFNLEKRIREHQFRPSEQGQVLTQSLLRVFEELNTDAKVSIKEIKQLMVYLLEEEISEILGIDSVKVPVYLPFFMKTMTGFQYLKAKI